MWKAPGVPGAGAVCSFLMTRHQSAGNVLCAAGDLSNGPVLYCTVVFDIPGLREAALADRVRVEEWYTTAGSQFVGQSQVDVPRE